MRTLIARPALRWLVPLVALIAALGTFLVVRSASADSTLPPISKEALLAKVADGKVDGLWGTVVENADLGIPAIPGGSDSAGGKLTSLLAGSHKMAVYYGSPDRARLAIQDDYAETDIVSNGTDVWTYDSRAKTATHTTLSGDQASGRKAPEGAPQTPQDLAKQFLDKVSGTTDVRVDPDVSVAGVAAYDLVLTPKDGASLVKQVRIAVDGTYFVPLRVQVFGAGDKPALDVEYSEIHFGQPDARMFAFNPPEGTKVTQKAAPQHKAPTAAEKKALADHKAQAQKDTTTVGTGWSTVVVTKLPDGAASGNETLKGFLGQLKPVSGSWGTGRELDGTIVTAILTDDGRLAVGSVNGDVVSAALAR